MTCTVLLTLSLTACKKDDPDVYEEMPLLGTCQPVTAKGRLSQTSPDGPFTFKTSGGGKIVIDIVPKSTSPAGVIITHDDYAGFKLELWGQIMAAGQPTKNSIVHENLSGKHIKDINDTRRTIIFPDGAKITMITDGAKGQLISVSIYDGAESHHINAACNKLEHSSTVLAITQQLDKGEPDGEAGGFEFTSTGLIYVNLYSEDASVTRVEKRTLLGEILRNQPNMVNDYYDDPRLAAT